MDIQNNQTPITGAIEKLVAYKSDKEAIESAIDLIMPDAISEALSFGKSGLLGKFGAGKVTLKFTKVAPKSEKLDQLKELVVFHARTAIDVNSESIAALKILADEIAKKISVLSQSDEGREIQKEVELLTSSMVGESKPGLSISFK